MCFQVLYQILQCGPVEKRNGRRKAMLTKTTSISVISAWTVKISDVVKVISVATVARALGVVTAD